MLNRKLFEVLKELNPAQHKRLRLFLCSPYFNNGVSAENTVRLYDLLVQYNSDESHAALAKKKVHALFFSDTPYRENAKSPIDNLASQLFQLVRQFLAQTELERDFGSVYDYLAPARFYRMHALEERFWQIMTAARKALNSAPQRDDTYYFQKFLLEQEEAKFRGLYNSSQDDNNLAAAQESLDRYYSIIKLDYACVLAYQSSIAQLEDASLPLLYNELMALTASGKSLDLPVNQVYRLIIQLLKESSEKNLLQLDQLLKTYKDQINPNSFKNLNAFYRILWTKHYFRDGKSAPLERIFKIYREHLERGYFYLEDRIPTSSFNNLVIYGLRVGETAWVKKLLDDHPPERICGTRHPHEIHSLCMAEYYFVLKEYDQAHDCLQYCNFENPSFTLMSDLILLKIYFETQNELLEFRLKAIDQKIRRTKLSRTAKTRYFNFLKKLDKVIKYGWQKNSPKRTKLIEEIKSVPEIVSREWLLEKVME
ncbi:MAG: hypothetical protein R3D58_11025 [Saprospiraceae bacterium]